MALRRVKDLRTTQGEGFTVRECVAKSVKWTLWIAAAIHSVHFTDLGGGQLSTRKLNAAVGAGELW